MSSIPKIDVSIFTPDDLRALPEGSVIVTHGICWAKTGPDEWRCPYRMHVLENLDHVRDKYPWHDIRDSAWLSKVATRVVYNPADDEALR